MRPDVRLGYLRWHVVGWVSQSAGHVLVSMTHYDTRTTRHYTIRALHSNVVKEKSNSQNLI